MVTLVDVCTEGCKIGLYLGWIVHVLKSTVKTGHLLGTLTKYVKVHYNRRESWSSCKIHCRFYTAN